MRKFLEVKRFAEVTQLVSTTWAHILSYSKAPALLSELKKKKKRHLKLFSMGKIRVKYHIVPSLSLPVPILMLFEYC